MEFEKVARVLHALADGTVEKMRKHIERAGKDNTGRLKRSIGWKVIQGGIEFFVKAPYATFVLKGRRQNAKQPPQRAILTWLTTKHGRRAYARIKRRWPKTTLKGAAYVIARSIKRKGIKPLDFYNPHINTLYNKEAFHEIEAAYIEEIEDQIENKWQ